MILTQNVIEGNWTLNTQTKFLIEKERNNVFNKIAEIIKQKNFRKEEQNIIIIILVLYYLLNKKDINKSDYIIIINKGFDYLKNFEIDYDEIKKECNKEN